MKRLILIVLSFVFLLSTIVVFAEDVKVESLKIGLDSTVMKVGETQKIIVSVTPTTSSPEFEYESDNPDVVTAAIGTLIAKSEGVANITVKVARTHIQDTVMITVSNKTQSDEPSGDDGADKEEFIKVNKITPQNKYLYLERYETEHIVYSVYPKNATNTDVSFESSNTSVATVDNKGYVYGKKRGNATITIQSDDGGANTTVKVYVSEEDEDNYDSTLRSIDIIYDNEVVKNKLELMEKTTLQLGIKPSPSSASKKVNWRSSNKKIATVDASGKVTGVKKGTCTIYATSTGNSSKRDSITVVVTDYVRYPDKITVTPQENAEFETEKTVSFTASLYPEDTTETDVIWDVSGGATITQNGVVTIIDGGEITVKAYSSNKKTVGEYKFNASYGHKHFDVIGGAYNLMHDKNIEMYFDADVSAYSATNNIFASCDASGNGERINLSVKTDGKKLTVAPKEQWPAGNVYVFIKGSLSDIHGNAIGKNMKYILNIRGNSNGK